VKTGDDLPFWGSEERRSGGPGVRVQWLGTAGFALESGGYTLLLDPYLTRASLLRCVVAPLRSDGWLVGRYTPRADAIVVGHTHFDHALDVPAIARQTGARVFGSRSCAALCLASGVPARQVRDVETEGLTREIEAEVGPFRLRFVPSAHSSLLLGRVPFPGEISDCDAIPLRTEGYRCGAVFSVEIEVEGKRIYHLGSANLIDGAAGKRQVDLLLLCVAGWTTTERFVPRVLSAFAPRRVLLSHWDNFFVPLDSPGSALPAMQVRRLVDGLQRGDRAVDVGALPLLGELWL
jgi:L-ascorbate metabolism protein UlaG (beta-lactamase superfamily)